jgi:peptidyl-prolyl cis-trans isomerase SurA
MLLVVATTAATLATSESASSGPSSPPVIRSLARVDTEVLTNLDILRRLGRIPPSVDGRLSPAVTAVLVDLTIHRLEVARARALDIEIPPRILAAAFARHVRRMGGPDRLESYLRAFPVTREDIRNDLRDRLLVRRLYMTCGSAPARPGDPPLRGKVRPSEVRAHYLAHSDRYVRPASAHIALIEIRGPRDGKNATTRVRAVVERLKAGDDFTELARAESSGPGAEKGGDLGWIEQGHLAVAVDEFAFSAAVDGVSDPLPTRAGGWWIVRVLDRRPEATLPFEEVQGRIADEIRTERMARVRRIVLGKLVAGAVIEPEWLRKRALEKAATISAPRSP